MRILIAALLFAPATAFAAAYAIPNENARSIGLSQSDVAAQTGPEATYQNSSALSRMNGLGVTANVELIYNRTSWSDPALGSASLQPHANFPPMLAVAYGGKLANDMGYGLGIAFLVPGGGSLFWPTGWQGSGRIQSVDQKVYLTQVGGGFQPLRGVRVGASFLWYRITEALTQEISFAGPQANASLGLAGNAYAFGLSGEFDVPNTPLTFGVDYRHQAVATITGQAHFDNTVPSSFVSQLQDQGAQEHITVPNQLFLGASYDIGMSNRSDLRLMGSFTLERWIVYRDDTYVGDKGLVITVPRNYHNAQVYRLGAEYSHLPFLPPLTLRAGIQRSISPQPTNTISPTLTDANSTGLSIGAGFNFTRALRFDAGYQFAFFDDVTATGTEAFPGRYSTHVSLVSAGITWTPGKL